jgi:hypothetical protein
MVFIGFFKAGFKSEYDAMIRVGSGLIGVVTYYNRGDIVGYLDITNTLEACWIILVGKEWDEG